MLREHIPQGPHFITAMLGLALLLGWGAGLLCRRLKVPMVVGYIITGIFLGRSVLGIFNADNFEGLVFFSHLALACIGFDIGGELALRKLRGLGKSIIWISLLEALGAFVMVAAAVYLYTGQPATALVFGALASATAPAATVDVLREYNCSGPLTSTLFAVVGIDDAIAIIIYAFSIFFAKMFLVRGEMNAAEAFLRPALEILGALALGCALGLAFLFLIRRYAARRGLLVLTCGAIALATGLANQLGLSLILTNMAMGLTAVNLTRWRRDDVFEVMRGITQPLFVVFFVLVGAQLDAGKLWGLGMIGLLYIIFRSVGKQAGSWLGAAISRAPDTVAKYLGLCLFSQAGVAIGLSIQTWLTLGGGRYGDAGVKLGNTAISVIAATTLVFQLIGPPCTRYAVFKAGETNP